MDIKEAREIVQQHDNEVKRDNCTWCDAPWFRLGSDEHSGWARDHAISCALLEAQEVLREA